MNSFFVLGRLGSAIADRTNEEEVGGIADHWIL